MVVLSDIPPPSISCTLLEQRQGTQVRIGAQIRADVAQSGTYRLEVIKSGPSGSSQISQQSEFTLDAGRSVQILGLSLSMEPSARYRAVLSVKTGGSTYACERTGPGGTSEL